MQDRLRAFMDARCGILFFDYDGTLAPFVHPEIRHQTYPYKWAVPMLTKLHERPYRIVLVSGRPAREVQQLLRLPFSFEIWGAHGLERLREDGSLELPDLPPEALIGLDRAQGWAQELTPKVLFERKSGSVAVHWRGQPEARVAEIRSIASAQFDVLSSAHGLLAHPFDGGLELKVPGFTKARAVHTVMAEAGEGTAVFFAGDDQTDEDGFAAVNHYGGLSIRVGTHNPSTNAVHQVEGPEELRQLLQQLL